jgi:NAD(P)-dependent dehydrogenase (short-subunit alcohol dehydrogenase family)
MGSIETLRPVALALADAGAAVALTTATADAEEAFAARRLAQAVVSQDRRSLAESVDMSLGTNVQVAVRQVAKAMGGIDLLVLAPALLLSRPAERLSDSEWARIVGLNLNAVFYACRAVGREMLSKEPRGGGQRGRIIVAVRRDDAPGPGLAALRAARAGARELVRALDEEWSPRGVRVAGIDLASGQEDTLAAMVLTLAMGDFDRP